MKIRLLTFFALSVVGCLLVRPQPASALSLRMQPLLYKATLQKDETKKGFIDISNTSGRTLTLRTSVQAFRQQDEHGSLQFYDEPSVQAGIIPDLKEFTLKPGEALHLAFLIDGRKLPPGDVFAALFVATKPAADDVATQSVRIGTLFTLVNGKSGVRQAEVTGLNVPLFNFGTGVNGSYRIKNTADPHQVNGFYPDVKVSVRPLEAQQTVASPLVTAGNSREVPFSVATSRVGVYRVQASYGGNSQTRWIFIMTGYWRWLAPLVLFLLLALFAIGYRWRHGRLRFPSKRR